MKGKSGVLTEVTESGKPNSRTTRRRMYLEIASLETVKARELAARSLASRYFMAVRTSGSITVE